MNKLGIIFLYKKFFPIKLGSDVHGYNLAKELHNKNYNIFTAHHQSDGFTQSMRGIGTFFKALSSSKIAYLRISLKHPYVINSLGILFKLFGKKIVLEFNAPFEELRFDDFDEKVISRRKKHFKLLLKFTNGIVVVSEPLKKHLQQEYGFSNVKVIPNGGEKFANNHEQLVLSDEHIQFNQKYPRQVIWVANFEYIQGLESVVSICNQLEDHNIGVVIVDNSDSGVLAQKINGKHIYFLRNPRRELIGYALSNAIAGFAFYDTSKYETMGMEFFNSPLKIYEYLANNLHVISNLTHQDIPVNNAELLINTTDIDRAVSQLSTLQKLPNDSHYRSWADVAYETELFFNDIINEPGVNNEH